MAKVLQVIDVDSDGHKVRLDDGRVIVMPHGGEHPTIGQEVSGTGEPQSTMPQGADSAPVPGADSEDEPPAQRSGTGGVVALALKSSGEVRGILQAGLRHSGEGQRSASGTPPPSRGFCRKENT